MLVEIWSDIACPWCFVGKRRLEAALRDFPHRDDVVVHWRAFELDPGAPAEREGDYAGHLARKYGQSLDEAGRRLDEMTDTAAQDGLAFRFDRTRAGSTFDAHRLVHLAAEHGLQDAMKERLFAGYLEQGELMADHDTLRAAAADVGLPADLVADLLASDLHADEVRDDERIASELGITGVPFFVVDRRLAASGAQPPELLGRLLQRAWDEREPAGSPATDQG